MRRVVREARDLLEVSKAYTFKGGGSVLTFSAREITVEMYFKLQALEGEEQEIFFLEILGSWYKKKWYMELPIIKKYFKDEFINNFLKFPEKKKILNIVIENLPKQDPSNKKEESDGIASISRTFTAFCKDFGYTPAQVLRMPAKTYMRMLDDNSYITRAGDKEGIAKNKEIDSYDRVQEMNDDDELMAHFNKMSDSINKKYDNP